MAFLKMVTIGVIGLLMCKRIRDAKEEVKEERRRKNIPCYFVDGITREQFVLMVKHAGKNVKRLKELLVDNAVVYGTVRSKSGYSEWNFRVDFNDYGHLTGRYWLLSDNSDSNIPSYVANNISSMIHSFPEGFGNRDSGCRSYANSHKRDEVDYDFNEEHVDLEKIKQQAEIFKKRKKKRQVKKIKQIFVILMATIILCGMLFVIYRYWEYTKEINVGVSSSYAIGCDYDQMVKVLEEAGFTNIHVYPDYDLEITNKEQENSVSKIEIHGDANFNELSRYPYDAKVEVTYHAIKNIYVPISAKDAKGMNYEELEFLIREAGFINVRTDIEYDLITGWLTKDGSVKSISINGEKDFTKSSSYRPDVEVVITFHTFKKYEEN